MELQVNEGHYGIKYDSLERFSSYYTQLKLVSELSPKSVIEVGIGNGLVSDYLKKSYKVTTCDFDHRLNPDIIFDVSAGSYHNIFHDPSDVVLCCQVLEHLPYDKFRKCLINLSSMSNKYVIISLPYCSSGIELNLKFPFIKKFTGKERLDLFLRIPTPIQLKPGLEHYWEIGRPGYPIRRIRKDLLRYFDIVKEVRPTLNYNHHFFILSKNI